jgi:hypothetical protein
LELRPQFFALGHKGKILLHSVRFASEVDARESVELPRSGRHNLGVLAPNRHL